MCYNIQFPKYVSKKTNSLLFLKELSLNVLVNRHAANNLYREDLEFLIPLTESKWILTNTVLQQVEKTVSAVEALKYMEERAKKSKKPKPKAPSSSPLASSPGKAKKRKHVESNLGLVKRS